MSDRTPNQNLAWSPADREKLAHMWADQTPLVEMAEVLGRSGSSIAAQLTVIGLVYFSQKTQAYHYGQPVWTLQDVRKVDKHQARPLIDPEGS